MGGYQKKNVSRDSEQMNERMSRLPRWAQARLIKLETDIADLKRQQFETAEGDTNVFINDYTDGEIPLPFGTRVIWRWGGATFEVHTDPKDGLVVHLIRGPIRMAVLPSVANVVHIRGVD